MASLKYYLDTRRAKQDNKYPLKIKVSLNSRNGFMINLKVSLWEDQWNGIEITNHLNKKPLNSYIKRKYADVEDALYRLEFSLFFICYLEINLLCLRYNSSSYLHKCSEMQVKCKYAITYVLSK